MSSPAREYDDMELQTIEGIKYALREAYATYISGGASSLPAVVHGEAAEAAIDAWAKDIYERHCAAQGPHTEPSPQELQDWVTNHGPTLPLDGPPDKKPAA